MKRPHEQDISSSPPEKKRALNPEECALFLETNKSSQLNVPSKIQLGRATIFRIGRSHKVDIQLACPQVSRLHATLHRTKRGWILKDQKSHNGTFVNGFCVSQCSLRLNDIITFGGHKKPQVNDRLPCMRCEYCLKSPIPFVSYKLGVANYETQETGFDGTQAHEANLKEGVSDWFSKHPALKSIYDSGRLIKPRLRALQVGNRLDHLPPDSIAYKVALQLFLQKKDPRDHLEKQQTEFAKKRSLMEDQIKQEFGLTSEMFEQHSKRWQMLFQLSWRMAQYKSEKSCDLDYTSCEWTERMLMKYLQPNDILSFTPISQVSATAKLRLSREVRSMMTRIAEVGDSLYGWKPPVVEGGTGLDQLPELGYCEAVSRLFIDIVLVPLVNVHNMKLQLEETHQFCVRNDIFPTARFDYLILSGRKAHGVLEAKRAGVPLPRALVQTLLQLLLLASAGSQNQQHGTLVGLVSDGLRWLFVILSESRIYVSNVYNILTQDDLQHLAQVISNLLLSKFPEPIRA